MAQAPDELNLDLLIKMMGMTTSDNDNMALVAIRKVNSALSTKGWDWDRLLRGKITIVEDPWANSRPAVNKSAQTATNFTPPRSNPQPPSWASQRQRPDAKDFLNQPHKNAVWDSSMDLWIAPPRPRSHRDYIYDSTNWEWKPKPQPAPQPAPMSTQPTQTAIVNYTSRGGEWILSSTEKLTRSWTITVIKKDGSTRREVVGTYVEDRNGRYLYNIEGKTHQVGASGTSI